MESAVIRSGRRGRKRKSDIQNALGDQQGKRQVVGTRSKALVGRYVKKEFEGSGIFLGKIVFYEAGLYRVDYEDGDCEDLESGEVRGFLIGDDDLDGDLILRKKKLDELVAKKDAKAKDVLEGNVKASANAVDRVDASSLSELANNDAVGGNFAKDVLEGNVKASANAVDRVDASSLSELANNDAVGGNVKAFMNAVERVDASSLSKLANNDMVEGNVKAFTNAVDRVDVSSLSELTNNDANEIDADQIDIDADADSSSDSCEHARDQDFSSEVDVPVVPPPHLPPSSGNIGVPEEYVSHLLSVYSFLRSFSIQLFLSPFRLDDFVGSLNCLFPNTLLDAIHVALMRPLRRHLEMLSSDGSELASKCLRFMDWTLLDTVTWPVYVVQYLMVMRYTNGPEWKGFYIDALEKDYYTLSAGRKLLILQILCDGVVESEELRAEIDMREESEVGLDSDAVAAAASESGPRRVHPRYSKTSACKNGEAMEIMEETHGTKSSRNSSYLGVKVTEGNGDSDTVHDGNSDECRLCGMDGTLLCCDGCPSAYHSRCIGVSKMFIPDGAWYCPECTISKIGPTITRGTSLKGAEIFGVDSYGQVFLGTCNHLLVLKVSIKSESCLRYYNQNDIPKVLQALYSSVQHIVLYSEICKGILQYWDIQKNILPCLDTVGMCKQSADIKDDGEYSTPSLSLLGKENNKILDLAGGQLLSRCVPERTLENAVASCLEISCEEPGFKKSSLDTMTQTEHLSQHRSGDISTKQIQCLNNSEFSEQAKVHCTVSSGSVIQQGDSSDLTHQSFSGKSSLTEFATCTSGNSNGSCRISSDDCLYTGLNFKSHAYINNYIHGEFAASAAANLAILSSEEVQVYESHGLDNRRKIVSANNLLQMKAFSSAAIRFFWPNSEKKLVEVPRERCGWCLSCKVSVTSKRGCLLNAAASNAVKGAMKFLAGLRPIKSGEGNLPGIAMYLMFMEESLCGLTVGTFRSATYRQQWRKQVEQATTCSEIKALLLELEENIHVVALSGDWIKLVDNLTVDSSVTQSVTFVTGSTQKRGTGGRRGRKPSAIPQITSDDCLDNLSDFNWWRRGMLSKTILRRGVLPSSMIKKAARQGGCKKIPGIYYAEGSDIPKISRQYCWRAAVELSKNASQLALQVRYLDLHVRWGDLARPEQNLQDGKGPETEASAFRNAFVCDKKNVDDKIFYGVAFGNQKHLPSRVMKNIIEVEQSQDGREKYWFSETRVPLYLIKEYEENVDKMHPPFVGKSVNVLSKLQRRQLKAARMDIFTYLSCKTDNLDRCCCASCQLDVLLRNAVKCSACQGFCHEQCAVISTIHGDGRVEFVIACKQCYHTKTLPQSVNSNESPTSPLLFQGQEFQNALTANKGGAQKSFNEPLTSVGHSESSSERKSATHDSSSVPKNRRKICSWGLIWKKKNAEDNGIDFRLKNILLRGNSDMRWSEPVCHICQKPYNPDLMYIRCDTCNNWYHAEAVELEESKIFDVVGFKCCRCRRIRSPVCPYMDPESKKKLEAKRPHIKAPKAGNLEFDPDNGTISEQPKASECAPRMLPKSEAVVCAREDNPLAFSLSTVEQFMEHNSEMDFEWNTVNASASGSGPQKLPVRRHTKNEKNVDANNLSQVELSVPIEPNNFLNLAEESLSPCVEWDVSNNGFEEGMLFDYEGLNYENVEFEPQTYFSFTELLAPDGGGQLDEVDASGDVMGVWDNSSAGLQGGFPEQRGMGTDNQQEPPASVEPCGDLVPCRMCSRTEPCPDLCCQICGLCIHSHCSPWVDQSYLEGNWRCGPCREWQ